MELEEPVGPCDVSSDELAMRDLVPLLGQVDNERTEDYRLAREEKEGK